MRTANIAVIECEGVTCAGRLPTESSFCKSTFATLFGQIEIDVVEALTARKGLGVSKLS